MKYFIKYIRGNFIYNIYYMFKCIVNFLRTNREPKVFNKSYRDGYNKLWINNIRDYRP